MTLEAVTQHQKSIRHLLDAQRIYEAIIELSPIVEEVADYHLKGEKRCFIASPTASTPSPTNV